MILHFSKMQGLGNDFVVIDAVNQRVSLTKAMIKQLATRHFGVGCDQVLLVEPTSETDADFFYRIYNADGGEVSQCGNGARCVAKFIERKKLSNKAQLTLATASRFIAVQSSESRVNVDMGLPVVDMQRAPVVIDGKSYPYIFVDIGNPHAIIFVKDLKEVDVERLGAVMNKLEVFPDGVNVEFVKIESPKKISMHVYERGVGKTLACGSGAVAATVAGILKKSLDNQVTVLQQGGELTVKWLGNQHPVWLSGPAEFVFEGSIDL